MTKRRVLQVFEHDTVRMSGEGTSSAILSRDLKSLERLHDETRGAYFDLVRNGVKFGQHVGVIQVGDLVIEVLPKASRHVEEGGIDAWRTLFLQMLARAGLLPAAVVTRTQARLKNGSLLDIYIAHFLEEVRTLVRTGLLKRYRSHARLLTALKGRLNFAKQIQSEASGDVRFQTTYQTYDPDHRLNQILAVALDVISRARGAVVAPELLMEVLDAFSSVSRPALCRSDLEGLAFDRGSSRYKAAIELARPIIFSLVPTIRSGSDSVLTFMFDMNLVWERYVLAEVRRAAPLFNAKVTSQRRVPFWEDRKLRPDIVVEMDGKTFVFDTKWKALKTAEPSDDDLRQMFAYSNLLQAERSVLLYPNLGASTDRIGAYWQNVPGQGTKRYECAVGFLEPWKGEGRVALNDGLGVEALRFGRALYVESRMEEHDGPNIGCLASSRRADGPLK